MQNDEINQLLQSDNPTQEDINRLKEQARTNINSLFDRDAKLNSVMEKTEQLSNVAKHFKTSASKLEYAKDCASWANIFTCGIYAEVRRCLRSDPDKTNENKTLLGN